jgi:hypothetical protein
VANAAPLSDSLFLFGKKISQAYIYRLDMADPGAYLKTVIAEADPRGKKQIGPFVSLDRQCPHIQVYGQESSEMNGWRDT